MTARYIYNNVYALLVSCLLLCLTACSGESAEGGPDAPGQPVTLRLQIGTSTGTNALPQTKAETPETYEHELIHSLKVFITDASGQVEKVVPFTFSAEQNEALEAGNLESCISDEFTITTGAKTIYAFANYEEITELASISNDNLSLPSTITWDKEANWKPGTDNGFIPMTVKKEVTIGTTDQTISIELVRMLSRLVVSFQNKKDVEVKVANWGIEGFASTIGLFEQIAASDDGVDWKIVDDTEINVPANNSLEAGYYYVPETYRLNGFPVHVKYGDLEQTKYTTRVELPRNNVWPLEIVFSDYGLTIEIEGINPPIGGYPDVTTDTSNSTVCDIRGGGPFTLTPILTSSTATIPDNITWAIDDYSSSSSSLVEDLAVTDGKTITGTMKSPTKDDETSYTFKLTAKEGDRTITSFEITLRFVDIF